MKLSILQKFIVFAILGVVFILQIFLAKNDSLTTDEKVHIPAGYLHVFKGNYDYNSEHPPLANDLSGLFVGLFARPQVPQDIVSDQWQYGEGFLYSRGQNADKIIFWGRFPIIVLSILLLYLVFSWAYQFWGFNGGLISLILAATCPNLLANGHLATTDLILALSYTLNFYLLWKFSQKQSWKNAVHLGLAMAFVLLSKFSGIIVLPADFIILIIVFIYQKKDFWQKVEKTFISYLIAFIVLWLIYFVSMRGEMYYLFNHRYGLNHFQRIDHYLIDLIKWIRFPIKKFHDGFNIVRGHNEIGHISYLNGVFSMSGRWQYFPYAFFYKTPIPAMALFFLSLMLFFKGKFSKLTAIMFVFLPMIVFFISSLKSNINIGIRHALPIYPLAYIFIGSVFTIKDKILSYFFYFLVGLNIVVTIFAYPQYLAYFNQFAGGTSGGINHLSDSNLDWSQNVKRFSSYLKDNDIKSLYFECYDKTTPAYYGINALEIPKNQPLKGVVAMCAQQYLLHKFTTSDYRWFINSTPTQVIDGTIYLWDLR